MSAGSCVDAEGWQVCEEGKGELSRLAKGVDSDPEVRRVIELWKKYCSRYERPRNPVKRQIVPRDSSWPGAKPTNRR